MIIKRKDVYCGDLYHGKETYKNYQNELRHKHYDYCTKLQNLKFRHRERYVMTRRHNHIFYTLTRTYSNTLKFKYTKRKTSTR